MTTPVTYIWSVRDVDAISSEISLSAGKRSLYFNGILSANNNPLELISFGNISRTIILSGSEDLSGVTFTVNGLYNDVPVTENIVGPQDNAYVQGSKFFNKIISITASADVPGTVDVGYGNTGVTNWFPFNYFSTFPNITIQTKVSDDINYSFQVTCDDIVGVTQDAEANLLISSPVVSLTNATTSKLEEYTAPVTFLRLIVNSSNQTGSMKATIMQLGIT